MNIILSKIDDDKPDDPNGPEAVSM